jgi:hypothetical protein
MLRLYEVALKNPDLYDPIDRYAIGQDIGLQRRGVETICKTLLRTNFIKQDEGDLITITPHGIKLVEYIRDNH